MDYRDKLDYLMSKGITMKLISIQTGINTGTLYNYKRGFQTLSKDKMRKLSDFINDCEVFLGLGE